jgi:hypothetical protein
MELIINGWAIIVSVLTLAFAFGSLTQSIKNMRISVDSNSKLILKLSETVIELRIINKRK